MALALIITDRSIDDLIKQLKQLEPAIDIQSWPNIRDPSRVEFAVLWKQPVNYLQKFPKLKAVTSLGAGVDFICSDKSLSAQIKISRIVSTDLKQQMAQFVLAYILNDYRQLSTYKNQQSAALWQVNELSPQPIVGFLGLGKIGKFVATNLQSLGFTTIAYTQRSQDKQINCYQGQQGLIKVMACSDYIVCLLPLTDTTKNILNSESFAYCKKKPLLIHVGRGEQLEEQDLLQALDKNQLKHAVIDVFKTEPLDKNHIFWKRKDITITPHNAARSDIKQTAIEIIKRYNQVHNNKEMDLQLNHR